MKYDPKTNKREMNKLEHKLAKDLNMIRCSMSGAGIHKGDMRDDIFMIDLKFTYSDTSISIKKKDFQKLDSEAFGEDKIPVMAISINGYERFIIGKEEFEHYKKWREENDD